MHPSSTAARPPGQPVTSRPTSVPAPVREYRRDRKHLYRLEEFREAVALGGVVTSFCGLEVELPRGRGSDIEEATEPAVDDCITCVDIWRESRLVRL